MNFKKNNNKIMPFLKKKSINPGAVLKYGVMSGLSQFFYVLGIIFIVNNLDFLFKTISEKNNDVFLFLAPTLFLLIFVFSATISGLIMLGVPVYLLFDKKYQEAGMTVLVSLTTLFLTAVFIFLIIINF
ncbi:hypothetical protein C4569_03730 [Candidatus Parcubacteria bacterium]|nr:MAG: hypothetical protein C4569_03730 [Candidatus Parcubacteria bacterium]